MYCVRENNIIYPFSYTLMVQNMPHSLKTFSCPVGSIHLQKYFRQRWIKFFKGLRSALATLLVPVLSKVLEWVMMGRPETCTEDIKPYYTRWHEIFVRTKLHSSVLLASHYPSIFRKDVRGVALGAPSHFYSESNSTHLCLPDMDEEIEREMTDIVPSHTAPQPPCQLNC